MDEIFTEIEDVMSDVFNQGMAYQRLLDAKADVDTYAESVLTKWTNIRSKLEPEEGTQTQ